MNYAALRTEMAFWTLDIFAPENIRKFPAGTIVRLTLKYNDQAGDLYHVYPDDYHCWQRLLNGKEASVRLRKLSPLEILALQDD